MLSPRQRAAGANTAQRRRWPTAVVFQQPVKPEDAFGEYDAELVRLESAHLFPEAARVGKQFEGASEDGQYLMIYTVTDVADGKVVVDGNHPLAGKSLRVQCRVEGVRMAADDEIAHGPGGHHHSH